ncbi:MAG: hypothetical protein EOO42_21325, partial [Flavobacteriales bacterium]
MTKISFSVLILLFALTGIVSCKKDKVEESKPSSTTDRSELTKDSIFYYAKEVYLWNSSLPTYAVFKPRGFNTSSNQLTNFNAELFAITRYSINSLTGKPYEYHAEYPNENKFSYIDDSDVLGQIARTDKGSVDLDGKGNDLGYSLVTLRSGNNFAVYFRYTSPGSPAYLAGLRRGDYINEVNGVRFGTNYNAEINSVRSILNSAPNTIQLGGVKKNGNSFNVSLSKAQYDSSPIFKDSVLAVGNKKIGYLSYARFSNTANSHDVLSDIFAKFSSDNVTDLIVDLRYNGGGFVHTARHLANLIAPASLNGKVMFAEHFNATMQSGRAAILRNQIVRDDNGNVEVENGRPVTYADYSYTVANNTFKFDKIGPLDNVKKIVFIVSENTASASELLINIFKPYLDVKIVGTKTYGKPVGFFSIRIDNYDIYYSMFTSKNSANQGDYYDGMVPDAVEQDDPTRDFGNTQELNIAKALNYITT